MDVAIKFVYLLKNMGINFASGVPCAVQKEIIKYLSNDPDIIHIPATREEEAIGITAGAYLGGKKPVFYMQNSGLGNSINAITSLLIAYKIPVLLLITWRGCPGEDAPQHLPMGEATPMILNSLKIPFQVITKENMEKVVSLSFEYMKKNSLPVAILFIRGFSL
ncbi:MAG: sulfopyruvate decarboxylase subunit alpha [Candidatus Aenigmatarchaeota archaeon]